METEFKPNFTISKMEKEIKKGKNFKIAQKMLLRVTDQYINWLEDKQGEIDNTRLSSRALKRHTDHNKHLLNTVENIWADVNDARDNDFERLYSELVNYNDFLKELGDWLQRVVT